MNIPETITYSAKGHVVGRLWSGFIGFAATSFELHGDTIEAIKKVAEDGLAGRWHPGDFEFLTGVVLKVTKTITIEYNGKPFTNTETEIIHVGTINEDDLNHIYFSLL